MNNTIKDKVAKYYKMGDDHQTMAEKLHMSPRSLERYITQLRREGTILSRQSYDIRKVSIDIIKLLADNVADEIKPPKTVTKKSKKALFVQFTDWHDGRIVYDEYHREIYNSHICKMRVTKLMTEMLKLIEHNILPTEKLGEFNILINGDIADGAGIFESQAFHAEFSPPFQVMECYNLIRNFTVALLKYNIPVHIWAVKGNHGEIRFDNKKATDPTANWDIMLYLMLANWQKEILKSKNLTVNFSLGDYINFQSCGWKYHMRHLAPNQTETSGGKAKVLGWNKKHDFHCITYGHYHHYGLNDHNKITVIRGGCLAGTDEYSETLAAESDPIQLIWECTSERPVALFYPVDLGKRSK